MTSGALVTGRDQREAGGMEACRGQFEHDEVLSVDSPVRARAKRSCRQDHGACRPRSKRPEARQGTRIWCWRPVSGSQRTSEYVRPFDPSGCLRRGSASRRQGIVRLAEAYLHAGAPSRRGSREHEKRLAPGPSSAA